MPSPAKASSSRTLNVPPSSVRPDVLRSHRARSGAPDNPPLSSAVTRVIFSVSIGDCTMGTSADWFFRTVILSFRLYSNNPPTAVPSASASALLKASVTSESSADSSASTRGFAGGGGAPPTPPMTPPITPPIEPPATPAGSPPAMPCGTTLGAMSSPTCILAGRAICMLASCACGVSIIDSGRGTTGRRV